MKNKHDAASTIVCAKFTLWCTWASTAHAVNWSPIASLSTYWNDKTCSESQSINGKRSILTSFSAQWSHSWSWRIVNSRRRYCLELPRGWTGFDSVYERRRCICAVLCRMQHRAGSAWADRPCLRIDVPRCRYSSRCASRMYYGGNSRVLKCLEWSAMSYASHGTQKPKSFMTSAVLCSVWGCERCQCASRDQIKKRRLHYSNDW